MTLIVAFRMNLIIPHETSKSKDVSSWLQRCFQVCISLRSEKIKHCHVPRYVHTDPTHNGQLAIGVLIKHTRSVSDKVFGGC